MNEQTAASGVTVNTDWPDAGFPVADRNQRERLAITVSRHVIPERVQSNCVQSSPVGLQTSTTASY